MQRTKRCARRRRWRRGMSRFQSDSARHRITSCCRIKLLYSRSYNNRSSCSKTNASSAAGSGFESLGDSPHDMLGLNGSSIPYFVGCNALVSHNVQELAGHLASHTCPTLAPHSPHRSAHFCTHLHTCCTPPLAALLSSIDPAQVVALVRRWPPYSRCAKREGRFFVIE